MDPRYPILKWRSFYDIAASWALIAFAVWLTTGISWWLYPVSFFLIANRILALSLLCHEGLHRTLHTRGPWNDFLGRYFCAFPTLISFSKYRRLHLLHHAAVGSKQWDPDRHLYKDYPMPASKFLIGLAGRVLTLRTVYDFVLYYTEFPEALGLKRNADRTLFIFSKKSDFPSFLAFQICVLIAVGVFGLWTFYLAFFLAPLILLTQPYVMLIGGIQHGPTIERNHNVSRTVWGSKFYMWTLLPLDINFHAEHHLDPNVPHYWLRKKAEDLKKDGLSLWSESYTQTMRSLFSTGLKEDTR